MVMLAGFYLLGFVQNSVSFLLYVIQFGNQMMSLGFDDDRGVLVWSKTYFFSVGSFHAR